MRRAPLALPLRLESNVLTMVHAYGLGAMSRAGSLSEMFCGRHPRRIPGTRLVDLGRSCWWTLLGTAGSVASTGGSTCGLSRTSTSTSRSPGARSPPTTTAPRLSSASRTGSISSRPRRMQPSRRIFGGTFATRMGSQVRCYASRLIPWRFFLGDRGRVLKSILGRLIIGYACQLLSLRTLILILSFSVRSRSRGNGRVNMLEEALFPEATPREYTQNRPVKTEAPFRTR